MAARAWSGARESGPSGFFFDRQTTCKLLILKTHTAKSDLVEMSIMQINVEQIVIRYFNILTVKIFLLESTFEGTNLPSDMIYPIS